MRIFISKSLKIVRVQLAKHSSGTHKNNTWHFGRCKSKKKATSHEKWLVARVSGTPDWSRTNGLLLRRQPLYPTELRGHIQFLFKPSPLLETNELLLRRQPLYPTELPGHIQFLFKPAPLQETNELSLRRQPLYPTELRGRIQFLFKPSPLLETNELLLRRGLLYPFNYGSKFQITYNYNTLFLFFQELFENFREKMSRKRFLLLFYC